MDILKPRPNVDSLIYGLSKTVVESLCLTSQTLADNIGLYPEESLLFARCNACSEACELSFEIPSGQPSAYVEVAAVALSLQCDTFLDEAAAVLADLTGLKIVTSSAAEGGK